MSEYYVYVYLDPRKSEFKTDTSNYEHQPFYVGKGKGKRAWCHLDPNHRSNNKLKKDKIKRIFDAGYIPKIIFIDTNLTESEAMELEKATISNIGTKWFIKDIKRGPLTNMTSGGDGYTPCEELINANREKMLGENNPMYGKTHTPEAKEKIRQQSVKLKHSDTLKKKWSKDRTGSKNSRAKRWIVQIPDGSEVIVDDLAKFCKDNNINYHTLFNTYKKGKPVTFYRKRSSAEGYWLKSLQDEPMQQAYPNHHISQSIHDTMENP